MNLYAIKVIHPEVDVFVVLAACTAEAVTTLRKDDRVGASTGVIEHVALIGQNATVPLFPHPTVLY